MEDFLHLLSGDVIVASATPHGRSALAVVRGSGDGVRELFQHSLSLTPSILKTEDSRAVVVKLQVCDFYDRAVAVLFHAPKSYTGEDMVELSVHGNPVIVRAVLNSLISTGARLAMPGEFTMRAALHGKMNLIEAESVATTVEAQTERALVAARRTIQDSAEIKNAKQSLHDVLVEMVATMEFPEDKVSEHPTDRWLVETERVRKEIVSFLRRAQRSRKLSEGMTVAIAGEPNAGKSTLFNRIVGAERAIVTPHPGTTRDVIEATVEIAGIPVTLWDTAGFRDVDHPVEIEGIHRAENAVRNADMVLWLVDGTQSEASAPPQQMSVVILNKSDLGITDEIQRKFPDAISMSALTGDELEALLERIEAEISNIPNDAVMVSVRAENCLTQATDELTIALDAMGKDFWDVAQVSMERADDILSHLFVPDKADDIYEEIFSRFCIGK